MLQCRPHDKRLPRHLRAAQRARAGAAADGLVSIAAQTITTLKELEDVRADWRALWRGARAATIFQSSDWLIPWWRHFAPGQLVCVAVRCGEDLVGLAPLYRERGSQRLLPLGI